MSATSVRDLYAAHVRRWRSSRAGSRGAAGDREGIVLVGCGRTGREFQAGLRSEPGRLLAFTDNNPASWNTEVAGTPVLAPREAVARHGNRALFVISIGRVGAGIEAIRTQFRELGVRRVLHFPEAAWDIPDVWPTFFLNPDAFREEDTDACAQAYSLMADDLSRELFLAHLEWRVTLDASGLPFPSYDDQYFPSGVVNPRHCARFVDVGAFTGDTLLALERFAGDDLKAYWGFEPDVASYAELARCAEDLRRRRRVEVVTDNVAIGARRGMVTFTEGGDPRSHVANSGGGAGRHPVVPLDSLEVARPSYIKIDTEGFEVPVLEGAVETLAKHGPTVAIATYHRPRDLFELPLWLDRHAPGARFHLRSHGDAGVDLVCYAVRDP